MNKPGLAWILSIVLLAILIALPGGPFTFSVLIPVFLSRALPRFKLEIVFIFSIIFGVAFTHNFFSVHLFTHESFDPGMTIYGMAMDSLSLKNNLLYLCGFAAYLGLFFVLFKIQKKFFRETSFFSSIFLSVLAISLVWISHMTISLRQDWSFVFALSILMFSRHLFYLFNYAKFFDHFPRNRGEWAAVIQPFWFLIFESPESPLYEIDKSDQERLDTTHSAMLIFISCALFKIMMIVYMSMYSYVLTREWSLVVNEAKLINETSIAFLSGWREKNAFMLLYCLFTYSLSYLVNNFFIYGRMIVGMARLCGFQLPDYINSPWKSQSFSDFFSRTMYYYNIIIVNHFFYPALDFFKRFSISRRKTIFLSLNWALIFGGFVARFMRDIWKVYKFGFGNAIYKLSTLGLPYMIVLSLAVTISLYFQKKSSEKKVRIGRMLFYFFLYSLIMPLNFSQVFGGFRETCAFYLKILSLGIF